MKKEGKGPVCLKLYCLQKFTAVRFVSICIRIVIVILKTVTAEESFEGRKKENIFRTTIKLQFMFSETVND